MNKNFNIQIFCKFTNFNLIKYRKRPLSIHKFKNLINSQLTEKTHTKNPTNPRAIYEPAKILIRPGDSAKLNSNIRANSRQNRIVFAQEKQPKAGEALIQLRFITMTHGLEIISTTDPARKSARLFEFTAIRVRVKCTLYAFQESGIYRGSLGMFTLLVLRSFGIS